MSKNYYPEMMDEIAKKDVSQQEILDYFYRHKPHSVIEAIQAVRRAKQPSKAEVDRFEKHYAPAKPEIPSYMGELIKIKREKGSYEAEKFLMRVKNCTGSDAMTIVSAL